MNKHFIDKINKNIKGSGGILFLLDISKKDLWSTYIENIPRDMCDGYTSVKKCWNCRICKSFVQRFGGLVWIDYDYNIRSIWGFPNERLNPSFFFFQIYLF